MQNGQSRQVNRLGCLFFARNFTFVQDKTNSSAKTALSYGSGAHAGNDLQLAVFLRGETAV
jgi:hypothetical protein